MASTTTRMGSFYDAKLASSQLAKYRDKGPIPSTTALIEALKAEGVEGATLLDIGGGIGAIQHELLDAGVERASSVDAYGTGRIYTITYRVTDDCGNSATRSATVTVPVSR